MMPAALWNGPDDKALETAHLRFLREHYVSAPSSSPSSSKLGAFTMPAAPDIMHRLYRKPAMKALTHNVFACFGELASMVDPLYMLTVASQQAAAVDAPIGKTPGFGPYFAVDDRRYSIFKPFRGALLASVGRPQPTDDRYTLEAGPEPRVEVAEQACKVIGPLMEELLAYVVHNAAEMAAENNVASARRSSVCAFLRGGPSTREFGRNLQPVLQDPDPAPVTTLINQVDSCESVLHERNDMTLQRLIPQYIGRHGLFSRLFPAIKIKGEDEGPELGMRTFWLSPTGGVSKSWMQPS
ncbi:hypothetical protein CF319_g6807 [Tilletia indica]|nr:hypothetical protein CF319_g6807 [Tilletia indica]